MGRATTTGQNSGVFKITAVNNVSGTYDGIPGVKYVEADYGAVVTTQGTPAGTIDFFLNQDGGTGAANESNPPHLAAFRSTLKNGLYDPGYLGGPDWRAMHVFYVNGSGDIRWVYDTGIGLEWRSTEGWAIGQPQYWPLDFAPPGSIALNGALVSRTSYSRLFGALGTAYGVGDGSTTFGLPDARGLFVRGAGTHGSMLMANGSPFAGGAAGSTENDRVQAHLHDFNFNVFGGVTGTWTNLGEASGNNSAKPPATTRRTM